MHSRARAVTALIGASTLATSMASVAEAATTHSSAPSPQLAAATTTVCVTTSDVVRLAETWPQVERAVQRVRVAERHLARELRAEARAADDGAARRDGARRCSAEAPRQRDSQ